jgi:hypothetical protein
VLSCPPLSLSKLVSLPWQTDKNDSDSAKKLLEDDILALQPHAELW